MSNSTLSYAESAARFEESRRAYHAARAEQRQLLETYFQKTADFRVARGTSTGHGRSDYSSGKRLTSLYDLSNWRWLEITHIPSQLLIFLSLQPTEIDPNSGNLHVLYDRIGVYLHPSSKKTGAEALQKLLITDIFLPMDAHKLEDLEQIIRKLIHMQELWTQEGLDTRLV